MTVLGISGRKRSGKDSASAALVRDLGYTRIAFADRLKELTAAFLGLPIETVRDDAFKNRNVFLCDPKYHSYEGWYTGDSGAELLTGRDVFQRLGVACRETFGADFWVEQVMQQIEILQQQCRVCVHSYHEGRRCSVEGPHMVASCPCESDQHADANVVIPDVRFWPEVKAIKAAGGLVIRLNRADRVDVHEWAGPNVNSPNPPPDPTWCAFCGLKPESHPSHYSGDVHVSETELPDSGGCYDAVFEAASAEAAATSALVWVKGRTP